MNLTNNRAGVLSKQVGGYEAFVSHKLYPEGPEINIDIEMFNLASEASIALGELKGIASILPSPELFVAFYVRKEALLSSQIEGTECSMDEVIQVDEETDEVKPVYEVINYINAMYHGIDILAQKPLSINLIHEIHKKLLHGVRGREKSPGVYKTSQNHIGPPGSQLSEAIFQAKVHEDRFLLLLL